MYKKSLCILLLIALISGGGVFYNQFTNKEKTIETPSTDITENMFSCSDAIVKVDGGYKRVITYKEKKDG